MKSYQINKVGETTVGGYTLPTGFVLEVVSSKRTKDTHILEVVTCEADGNPVLRDQETNLANTTMEFPYDPSDPTTGNAADADLLLANDFESLLDTWFGGGNWAAL